MSPPPLERVLVELRSVDGWLADEDVRLLYVVDRATRRTTGGGDLLEIGAYKGKTAVVLGGFATAGERLVVVDPFGNPSSDPVVRAEQERLYGGLSRADFDATYARFHHTAPTVVDDFSTNLGPDAFERAVRLAHIDGAHDFASASHDLRLVRSILAEGGAIAFDDGLHRGAPGAVAAVWAAVAAGSLRPFATTTKVWLAAPAAHAALFEATRDGLRAGGGPAHREERIAGVAVLVCEPPEPPRRDPLRRALGRARRSIGKLRPPAPAAPPG